MHSCSLVRNAMNMQIAFLLIQVRRLHCRRLFLNEAAVTTRRVASVSSSSVAAFHLICSAAVSMVSAPLRGVRSQLTTWSYCYEQTDLSRVSVP